MLSNNLVSRNTDLLFSIIQNITLISDGSNGPTSPRFDLNESQSSYEGGGSDTKETNQLSEDLLGEVIDYCSTLLSRFKMKVPAVAPLPTRKVQTLLDFHDGLAASTEYRSQIETASFARPLPRKSCGCNIYTAFCAQMLRASQVLSIQSSGSTSDQTSPIFFASWQLSFGRYDAPKFERFR